MPVITKCHKNLHAILKEMGFQVVDEYTVLDYSIDCYVSEVNLGFEADGKLYHWKTRDTIRDAKILEASGIKILRLPESELNAVKQHCELRRRIVEFMVENCVNEN